MGAPRIRGRGNCRISSRRQKNDSQKARDRSLAHHSRHRSRRPSMGSRIARAASRSNGPRSIECKRRSLMVRSTPSSCVKLDRISRRQHEGVGLLADWCERGIRVVVVTQQIDLSGAVGGWWRACCFGLAEIELEYRRERQEAGIKVAKRGGFIADVSRARQRPPPHRAQELRVMDLTVRRSPRR